jgi:hypothetical protein
MILKLSTWLVVALAGGALVAGCGSSSKSTSSSQTTSTGASPPTPLTAQQVATCKHNIQALSTISASAKTKLELRICKSVAFGTQAAQQKAVQDACVELVNALHVPAGAARERALAVCKVK